MNAHVLAVLSLCAAVPPLTCAQPSGDQPACGAGAPQAQGHWFLAGEDPKDYAIGTDPLVTQSGDPTETLRATAPAPANFGTVMQTLSPAPFLGQRLTFSALVKTDEVADAGGLWMRVDGPEGQGVLAFYNMSDQPLAGTEDWTPRAVTLDVSADARSVSFGLWLAGPGQVWLDQVALVSCEPGGDAGVAADAGTVAEVE
jgi:hypothetical protein